MRRSDCVGYRVLNYYACHLILELDEWKLDVKKSFGLLARLKERSIQVERDVHRRFTPLPTFVRGITPKVRKKPIMNSDSQLTGQDTNVGLSWEMLVSEAAYKVVTAIERVFRL